MTIVIPAYKPDEKLIALLHDLKKSTDARLLVVNDGSGEAFEPIFDQVRSLNATLLVHPQNKGKGAAMKTAFQYLLKEGHTNEVICTADADGQHLPKDILRCLEEAKAHPQALILGSRAFRGEVPFRSRFGNAVSRFTFHLLMGKRIYDTQTGLRAFSAALLPEMLSVPGDRYEYEMQVLCNAAKKKLEVREVEIDTVYLEENKSSHFNPLRDAMRVYGLLLRNAFGRFFQFLSFLFSSGCAFVVDLVVYLLLFHLILAPFLPTEKSLEFVSLLIARILSSLANYAINRKVVFSNLEKPVKTLTLYGILAVVTFFVHEQLNALFLIVLSFPAFLALLLAQVIFFPISFLLQKYVVFRKENRQSGK